jgi:hypothetical protein
VSLTSEDWFLHHQLLPHINLVLTLDCQTGTVIFSGLLGLSQQDPALDVTNYSINIQVIIFSFRFSNSFPNPYVTGHTIHIII